MCQKTIRKRFVTCCCVLGLSILIAQPVAVASSDVYLTLEKNGNVMVINNASKTVIGISLHVQLPTGMQIEEMKYDQNNLAMYKVTPDNVLIAGISGKNYDFLSDTPLQFQLNAPLKTVPVLNKMRLFQYINGSIVTQDISVSKAPFPWFHLLLSIVIIIIGICLTLFPFYKEKLMVLLLQLRTIISKKIYLITHRG